MNISEEEIRRIIREEIMRMFYPNAILNEGIDIDYYNRVVSFNDSHQENVDTNDYLHPYIIRNDSRDGIVLSIFERKDNTAKTDGNPLVYALKGLNNWHFKNPESDIFALFRRFIKVTSQLNRNFDTLLVVPSHNQLNNTVFGYLIRIINFNNYFSGLFEKMLADDVENQQINYGKLENQFGEEERENARNALYKAFNKMYTENDGIFSYKYIPKNLRSLVGASLYIPIGNYDAGVISNAINDKDVLVFDDTVSSGKTLSDVGEAIRATFAPKSITFLTLFSPIQGERFQNTRELV